MVCYSKRIQIKISKGERCTGWSAAALDQPHAAVVLTELNSLGSVWQHAPGVANQGNSPTPWCPGFLLVRRSQSHNMQSSAPPSPLAPTSSQTDIVWPHTRTYKKGVHNKSCCWHKLYGMAQSLRHTKAFYQAGYSKGSEESVKGHLECGGFGQLRLPN